MNRTVTRVKEGKPILHNGKYIDGCIIEEKHYQDGGIDTIIRDYEEDVCLDCFHVPANCCNCTIDGRKA